MKILLIPLGVNRIPNLALLKLARWHRTQGDEVSVDEPVPDKVYVSSPFSKYNNHINYSKRFPDAEIEYGGYGLSARILPDNVERLMPDYSFIPELAKLVKNRDVRKEYYSGDYSIGYTSRGCIRHCVKPPCIVPSYEGIFRRHAHVSEFHCPTHKKIMLMDNNILADKEWFKTNMEYIIENGLRVMDQSGFDIRLMDREIAEILSHMKFYRRMIHLALDSIQYIPEFVMNTGTLLEYRKARNVTVYLYEKDDMEDLMQRFDTVKELGCIPFVMPDVQATDEVRRFARYVNRSVYKVCPWYDYQKRGWRTSRKRGPPRQKTH